MATVLLARHGRTTANASGVLAGRLAGVSLDDVGRAQATAAGTRLAGLTLSAVLSSPQTRCRQTTTLLTAAVDSAPHLRIERGLAECDYGEWQGRKLSELAKEPLWKTVQTQPSAAAFPGGESLRQMSERAVAAVRAEDERLEAEVGGDALWLAVSHGDVIKAVLADALGMHLDAFQRIVVDPASISIIRYTSTRPYVLGMNTHEGSLGWLRPPPRRRSGRSRRRTAAGQDAVVGGGAGPAPSQDAEARDG